MVEKEEKKGTPTQPDAPGGKETPDSAICTLQDNLSHLDEHAKQVILQQTAIGNEDRKPSYLGLYNFGTLAERTLNVIALVAAVGAGACLPLMVFVFGDLITSFVAYTTAVNTGIGTDGARSALTADVRDGCLYLVYIAIAMFFLTYFYMGVWTYNGEKISRRIREQYFRAVMRQNIAFWETIGPGEITTRLVGDMNVLQRGISEKVPLLVQYLSQFIAGFVVALVKDWRLALALSSILPLMFGAGSFYYTIDAKSRSEMMAHIGEGGNLAEEVFSAVRTVHAYGAQRKLADLYDFSNRKARKSAAKGVWAATGSVTVYYFVFYSAYALAFFFGTKLVLNDQATVGDIVACMEAIVVGALAISSISPQIQAINGAGGAAIKILPTIWRIPPIDSLSTEGKVLDKVSGEIAFRDVSLYYPSRPTLKVLDGFTATFPKGQVSALVGPSGSGKSSVIGLLERFYNPVAGQIFIDGHDIADFNLKWLRTQIGLVSQEPTLFAGTILDNVAFGLTNTIYESEPVEEQKKRVIDACKLANAHDFITKLSDGYDTKVGERGLLLSGGQAQRLAIARAVIANPAILILDEATSALDVTSERLVQKALNKAAEGRTTIAIAHRLSTIADAHQIIVLVKGKIEEVGTHSTLLEYSKGIYATLVATQNLRQDKDHTPSIPQGFPVNDEEVVQSMPTLGRIATSHSAKGDPESASEITGREMGLVQCLSRCIKENKGILWEYWPALIGTAIVGSAFPLIAILFGELMDTFTDLVPEEWQSRNSLLAGAMFGVAWAAAIGTVLQIYYFLSSGETLAKRLRLRLFQATLRQDIVFYDDAKNSTGALTSGISSKPQQIGAAAGMTAAIVLQSVVTLIVGLVVALVYAWKVALVALACVPLIMASGYVRLKVIELKDAKSEIEHQRAAQMACEGASAIRTVASLRREDKYSEMYAQSLDEPMRLTFRTAIYGNLLFSLGLALQFPILSLVFWYGSTQMIDHGLSTGNFFVALFGAIFSAIESANIFAYVPDISGAKRGAISAFKLLDSQPKINANSSVGESIDEVEGQLSFENLQFRYPTRPAIPVLQGFNLDVKPGQFVALVGPSGCGKSTIVQLVERFYDPIRGSIKLDGQDIRSINLSSLRSKMALVSQTPTLFDGTVRFNITLGALDSVSQEDIEKACRLANIHDFIETLPDGYETRVGGKGSQFSGGQKQRIAIARALIRNPKILLLDEATSALDTQSEKVVQDALDAASRSRTTIAIAHRLSTIQNADIICVLQDGVIAEKGTHEELVGQKGIYYGLVKEQSLAP